MESPRNLPIEKCLPKKTRLEALVLVLLREADKEDWKESSDPHIRALGVQHALQREPRLWMLPRDIYQEELLLPAIARLDGARAVEALRSAPSVLDHYADLTRNEARLHASARKRLAPKVDVSVFVVMTVLASLYADRDPSRSETFHYVRTAKHLGIERNAVRRIDKRSRMRLGGRDGPSRDLAMRAIWATISVLRATPEWVRGPSRN